MRVEQTINDQVVAIRRGAQEGPSVVDDQPYPSIAVGLLRVISPSYGGDGRVDLDGVHARGIHSQGCGNVVARASPHHQDGAGTLRSR